MVLTIQIIFVLRLISSVEGCQVLYSITSMRKRTCATIRINDFITKSVLFTFQYSLVRCRAMFRCLDRFPSGVNYYTFDDNLLLNSFGWKHALLFISAIRYWTQSFFSNSIQTLECEKRALFRGCTVRPSIDAKACCQTLGKLIREISETRQCTNVLNSMSPLSEPRIVLRFDAL